MLAQKRSEAKTKRRENHQFILSTKDVCSGLIRHRIDDKVAWLVQPSAVNFYVQPRASKTEVVGRHGDAIKIRVKASPVDGAANEELIRFLAKRFKVPRKSVELVSGLSSRRKQIAIQGMTPHEIMESLLGNV